MTVKKEKEFYGRITNTAIKLTHVNDNKLNRTDKFILFALIVKQGVLEHASITTKHLSIISNMQIRAIQRSIEKLCDLEVISEVKKNKYAVNQKYLYNENEGFGMVTMDMLESDLSIYAKILFVLNVVAGGKNGVNKYSRSKLAKFGCMSKAKYNEALKELIQAHILFQNVKYKRDQDGNYYRTPNEKIILFPNDYLITHDRIEKSEFGKHLTSNDNHTKRQIESLLNAKIEPNYTIKNTQKFFTKKTADLFDFMPINTLEAPPIPPTKETVNSEGSPSISTHNSAPYLPHTKTVTSYGYPNYKPPMIPSKVTMIPQVNPTLNPPMIPTKETVNSQSDPSINTHSGPPILPSKGPMIPKVHPNFNSPMIPNKVTVNSQRDPSISTHNGHPFHHFAEIKTPHIYPNNKPPLNRTEGTVNPVLDIILSRSAETVTQHVYSNHKPTLNHTKETVNPVLDYMLSEKFRLSEPKPLYENSDISARDIDYHEAFMQDLKPYRKNFSRCFDFEMLKECGVRIVLHSIKLFEIIKNNAGSSNWTIHNDDFKKLENFLMETMVDVEGEFNAESYIDFYIKMSERKSKGKSLSYYTSDGIINAFRAEYDNKFLYENFKLPLKQVL